jgi:uncharacterized RDD family membrane protein YckC
MNVNFLKRFLAYLIDIILVGTIMGIISAIFTTKNATVLSNQFLELNEQVINTKLDFGIYYSRVADITLSLDRENFIINIINCVIIILYFVVLPLYKNGQTLGKKIFKIKIVREDKEDLTANELIIRNIVVNGLLNTFLAFCLVFLLSGFEYFTITSILGFIQFVLVVVSACMIIFRKDKKGLHDIITKTKVVYEEV